MRKLKTMSELEVMYCVYYQLLEKISHEESINNITVRTYNRNNNICQHKLTKLNEQLQEVRNIILVLESKNNI